jgi:hypothetical protein
MTSSVPDSGRQPHDQRLLEVASDGVEDRQRKTSSSQVVVGRAGVRGRDLCRDDLWFALISQRVIKMPININGSQGARATATIRISASRPHEALRVL